MLNKLRFGLPLVLLAALVLVAPVWAAQKSAQILPDPLTVGVKPGEQALMMIKFQNAEQVYGVELHLTFDPQKVELVDANPATAELDLLPGDWIKGGFIAQNKVDNAAGTIDFAASLLNPAEPVSGDQIIAVLAVRGKEKGESSLNIQQAILANRDGQVIPADTQNGLVGVSSSGKAPAVKAPSSPSTETNASASPTWILVLAIGFGFLAFATAAAFLGLVLVARYRQTHAAGKK